MFLSDTWNSMDNSMKSLVLAAALIGLTSAASAATLTVNAKANGQFGQLYSGGTVMITGDTLTKGDSISISATGMISIGENLTVGPNGIDLDSSSGKVSAFEYTPLEEAEVDATPALANRTLMPNLGALIAAFVPQATVDSVGFSARDTDFGGDILATDLFFVGDSLTFTAAFDGTLFFGINEAYVSNNSGAYTVTTAPSAVPLPASGLLLLAGLAGVAAMGRRKA